MQPDSVKREELEPAVPQRAQLAAPVSESVWTGAVRAAEDRPGDASSKVKTEATEPSLARASVALPNTYLPTPPPATTESASTAVDSQARTAPPAPPQATAQSNFVNGQLEGARANVGSSERTGTQAEVEPRRGLLEATVAPRPAQTQAASPTAPLTDANLSRLHNATAVEQSGEQAKEDDAQSNADSLSSASSSIAERAPVASSSKSPEVGTWTAQTASPAMKRLVRKRAEIFEVQRGARNHPLQASSRKKVEANFESDSSQGPYSSAFRNYLGFCNKCDIPPFPLTQTIIALWLFDKCSIRDGYSHTYKYGLMLAFDLVYASWKNDELYWEVSLYDPNGIALNEFLEERRVVHKKAKSVVSPKRPSAVSSDNRQRSPASKQPAPPSVSRQEARSASRGNRYDESSDGESPHVKGDLAPPIHVPGLPTARDRYRTAIELYQAYVAAVIPVYGIGVQMILPDRARAEIVCNRGQRHHCPWTAVGRRAADGQWAVDRTSSSFSHNHGPSPRILADPTYRPTVRNADARAALGMPPLPGSRIKTVSTTRKHAPVYSSESSDEEPLQKKPRWSVHPAAFPSTTGSHAIANPAPSYLKRPSPVSSYMVSHNAPKFPLRPSPAAAAPITSAPPVQPPAARLPMPPPALRPPPILQARLSDDPEQLVAAFCAGLHPSLDALAKPLVSIGIDSIEALIPLRLMDGRNLSRLLDAMRQRWTARRASDPSLPSLSLVHLNLFAKFVKA